MKWTVYLLIAIVISLIPCALYPEFIMPFAAWEDWHYGQTHQRVSYSGAHRPPALRVIVPVFVTIVLPPTWIAEHLGASRGVYGYLAALESGLIEVGGSFHYFPPGVIAAGEFLRFGLPFWFIFVASIGQLGFRLRHRAA